jgi:riboflavin kinase/FMN adenylyltransferase
MMKKKWIHDIKTPLKAGALCMGAFDGVHLGHKALIEKTVQDSGPHKAYALSFSPHPREFFYRLDPENNKPFERICTDSVNTSIIESYGVESVYYALFNQELSQKNTDEFLDYIKSFIDFSSLVVGFDFRLGSQRKGGQEELKVWCENNKVNFVSVEKVSHSNQRVSSTNIRKLLKKGDFQKAEELLGHPYFLEGPVVKDQGLGSKLGFATINLKLPKNLVLKNGVYAAVVQIETGEFPAVINLGHRPTVENNREVKTLEAHIIKGEVRGPVKSLKAYFKGFLRDEKKFESLTDLSLQVQKDVLDCRAFFEL